LTLQVRVLVIGDRPLSRAPSITTHGSTMKSMIAQQQNMPLQIKMKGSCMNMLRA
jgi:hypothetical protein